MLGMYVHLVLVATSVTVLNHVDELMQGKPDQSLCK